MSSTATLLHKEILEIPDAVEGLLSNGKHAIHGTANRARQCDPRFLLSVARGSSDHACTYLKYISELLLRRPMASIGPSIKSIYDIDLLCDDAISISVSQSGMSPDIVEVTKSIAASGGFAIALTNDQDSDLAKVANATLPIHAGKELSVAATKTFVNSLVTGIWLLAEIRQDHDLIAAIHTLPEQLSAAINCDWSEAANALIGQSLYTIGRGPCWAIANEAALKLKETCLIHAESYSSAEVMHGPVSIIDTGFPVIAFVANDAAEHRVAQVADGLASKGARVFATTKKVRNATVLPHVRTAHALLDPISSIVSFYSMLDATARRAGIDPDTPRHLNKITRTV